MQGGNFGEEANRRRGNVGMAEIGEDMYRWTGVVAGGRGMKD